MRWRGHPQCCGETRRRMISPRSSSASRCRTTCCRIPTPTAALSRTSAAPNLPTSARPFDVVGRLWACRRAVDDRAVAQAEGAPVPRAHDATTRSVADEVTLVERTAFVAASRRDPGAELLRHEDRVV